MSMPTLCTSGDQADWRGVFSPGDLLRGSSASLRQQEKEVRLALYRALKDSEPKRMFGLVDGILSVLKRASS